MELKNIRPTEVISHWEKLKILIDRENIEAEEEMFKVDLFLYQRLRGEVETQFSTVESSGDKPK